MMNFNIIRKELENSTRRGAWNHGVLAYAMELVDNLEEMVTGGYVTMEELTSPKILDKTLLNGAKNWTEYSWGGCSLIYNQDIAERLCNPTELKRTHNGERKPNAMEEWLDTQARALHQAANLISSVM